MKRRYSILPFLCIAPLGFSISAASNEQKVVILEVPIWKHFGTPKYTDVFKVLPCKNCCKNDDCANLENMTEIFTVSEKVFQTHSPETIVLSGLKKQTVFNLRNRLLIRLNKRIANHPQITDKHIAIYHRIQTYRGDKKDLLIQGDELYNPIGAYYLKKQYAGFAYEIKLDGLDNQKDLIKSKSKNTSVV